MTIYCRLLPEELPNAAEWVANFNSQTHHQVGYCGSTSSDILADFQEDFIDGEQTTLVAHYEQNQLVGLIGLDIDESTAEVWGPFHLHQSVSDSIALLDFARNEFPEIHTFLFFLHADNVVQQQVVTEIGAKFRGKHLNYVLLREHIEDSSDRLSVEFQNSDTETLHAMHTSAFPDTYYDTQTLIDRSSSPDHLLLMAKLDDVSIGYAYVEKTPDEQSAHLEYMAIDEGYRGKGLGTRWLQSLLSEIFKDERIQQVTLTVSIDNEAANPLYEKVGFRNEKELWFYRLG